MLNTAQSAIPGYLGLKIKANQTTEVNMTLTEWKEANKYDWGNIERQLTLTGNGSMFIHRIKLLIAGEATSSEAERRALQIMTKDEVCDYRG